MGKMKEEEPSKTSTTICHFSEFSLSKEDYYVRLTRSPTDSFDCLVLSTKEAISVPPLMLIVTTSARSNSHLLLAPLETTIRGLSLSPRQSISLLLSGQSNSRRKFP